MRIFGSSSGVTVLEKKGFLFGSCGIISVTAMDALLLCFVIVSWFCSLGFVCKSAAFFSFFCLY
jgi:hypothetical protein